MTKPTPKPRDTGQAKASAIYGLLSSSPANAWKEARRALKTHPKSERVQFVAGLVLIARGKKTEARKYFAEAIKLGTPGPDAYLNLALLSAEIGNIRFALDTLDRAETRFAGDLSVMMARVNIYRIAGDLPGALDAVNATLARHPDADDARLLQGTLLADTGRLLDAVAALESFLRDRPTHVAALLDLGRFYAFTNRPVQGLEMTERAYAVAPDRADVVENLAIRRRETGDFDGAASLFRHLIAMSPQHAPEARRQLADIIPAEALDPLAADVDTTLRETRSPEARAQLEFARAAVAKRRADDRTYVDATKRANRLMAGLRPYDARGDSAFHDFMRARYREEEERVAPVTTPDLPARPIFVMGLPRSGTTLLERMLSSAPGVAGLGEVSVFNRYFGGKMVSAAPVADGLADLRADYAEFQKVVGPADWTVDKMPANYMHIGWINRVLPEAKLILLRRDRRAVALSLFENYFDDAGQSFSFVESGIAHRLDLFDKTVADWAALGADFIDLAYEDLVSDPETSLRRVAAYCDLPFDPAMLRPQDNRASIRTASGVQARREINRDSVARWQAYPDLLPGIFGA